MKKPTMEQVRECCQRLARLHRHGGDEFIQDVYRGRDFEEASRRMHDEESIVASYAIHVLRIGTR